MMSLKRAAVYFSGICMLVTMLIFTNGCGSSSSKPLDEQLIGSWRCTDTYSDGESINETIEFYDNGTVSKKFDDSENYDWYDWSIVNDTILDVDGISRYDVEITKDTLILTKREDSKGNAFSTNYIRVD